VVDISEMQISDEPGRVLVTYSLGSCLGLSLYDPTRHLGGMIHCMLPLAKQDPEKAAAKPCMFTDSGVQALLQRLFEGGATRKNLVAKVAGCGAPLDDKGHFKIGERNHMVLRKILWKNEILIAGEDIGGKHPRTMYLDIDTGVTLIRTGGEYQEL